jgi:hypothetical protein
VAAGKQVDKTITVTTEGSIVSWHFKVESHDVGFAVYYKENTNNEVMWHSIGKVASQGLVIYFFLND